MGGKRGRPRIFEDRLERRKTLRLSKKEAEELNLLAKREGLNENSYLRKLLFIAYESYADEKMKKAAENYYNY